MPTSTVSTLMATPMQLGESPVWDPEEGVLYWIDIAGLKVHRFHPATGLHRYWSVPSEPGCIVRCAGGGIVVAMRNEIAFLDTDNGILSCLAHAPYDPSLMRFNDGRCDAAGRLWVGTAYDARDRQLGSLYCLERGTIRNVGNPVTVSNGVAFSVDNRVLYHADTTAHRISAYEFDLESGTLGASRILKEFPREKGAGYGGRPDGAAVDSEDAYWCAMYEGGRILRLSPDGEILQEVALPVRCPTMLAFGGADLRTLFITTVSHKRPPEELAAHPLSGCVLSLHVDVPGKIDPPYIR